MALRIAKGEPTVFVLLSDRGWILEKLASEIAKECPNVEYGTSIKGDPDLVYYMTYASRKQPYPGVEIGYFTHIEEGLPAEQLFYDCARDMDACVTQADRYRTVLEERGVDCVTTIPCGVDHSEFTPRLQIGIVGRTYHTGRKGETLVSQLMDMDHVEFHFTGDGWPGPPLHIEPGKMGAFYRSMDYILVPSLYEGGPMCVPEAIACGTPVIAPDVGWVRDFPHISYEKGNSADLRRVIDQLAQEKLDLARSATAYTWEQWVKGHASLFQETWERCGSRRASIAKNTRASAFSKARIVQVMHGGEKTSKGGPSLRVPKTAAWLEGDFAHAEAVYGATQVEPCDIAHLYNIWQPDSALETFTMLRERSRKCVFSPILLDLSLQSFWGKKLPQIISSMPEAEDRFTNAIPSLQAMYERELDRRSAALEGAQPAPGFAGKLRAIVSDADFVVFLSDCEKALAEAYCGPVANSAVLRNPVDTSLFCPGPGTKAAIAQRLETDFGIAQGSPFILSVGRVEVRKNQLLGAALAKELGMPLLLAGQFGGPSYAKLVREAGGGNVHFLGQVEPYSPDLLWLYRNCALFLSLSWAEGASLSALEAAATGAPLLLTDTSSEREYFGDIAEFTSPLDLERAVSKAQTLFAASCASQRIDQHEKIKERHNWPSHIETLLSIYSEIL